MCISNQIKSNQIVIYIFVHKEIIEEAINKKQLLSSSLLVFFNLVYRVTVHVRQKNNTVFFIFQITLAYLQD